MTELSRTVTTAEAAALPAAAASQAEMEAGTETGLRAVSPLRVAQAIAALSTGGYTNEQAQDAVGAMLANSPTVTLAYVDETPSLTASLAYPLYTPAIAAGALVINANSSVESYHSVSLDADISAGGITITGLPSSNVVRVNIRFTQATPGGTLYDVPVTAWSAFGTSRTWDTDWYCYQDATPSIASFESIDGGVNWRAYANTPEDTTIIRQADVDDTPVNGVTTAPVSSNWAYDHAALVTAHGISTVAATVLDDATLADMVNTIGGATSTGTGGLVRATSPTLTTPLLGTPTSGTLTNCTGLPTGGIVDANVTNAKLANMTASTFKMRVTASTGAPEDGTATQARAALDPVPQVVNAQTGTTYTLLMADKGKLVTFSNEAAIAVTVETSTATWASGDRVDLLNIGAGAVTVTGSGVTVSKAADQTAVLAQYKAATLIFTADNVCVMVGGMGAA